MTASADPLPRSLTPLPDESLPGFLLRLGHRLDLAPGFVAWRLGLAGLRPMTTTARVGHLFMLEADRIRHFTQAARISAEDAEGLTLRSLVGRYPPVTHALVPPKDPTGTPRPLHRFPPGVLVRDSRYCPRCLAGDGSPVQARHGGPWRRSWRLAVSFACLEHGVLLQHTCPRCRTAPGTGDPDRPAKLLSLPGGTGLHPAQCREEYSGGVCGQRLDDLTLAPGPGGLPAGLAALQARIDGLLAPDTPDRACFEAFADLHLLTTLILAGWPAAAPLLPPDQAEAVEAHVSSQRRRVEKLPEFRHRNQQLSWMLLPAAPLAAAAVLSVAARALTPPGREMTEAVGRLAAAAPRKQSLQWGKTWKILLRDASGACRAAVEEGLPWDLHPKRRVIKPASSQWVRFRTIPAFLAIPAERLDGYLPEFVPQEIPDKWFKEFHIGPPGPLLPATRRLRRAIAIHLVRAASGMDSQEAAGFLGIPADWCLLEMGQQPSSSGPDAREAEFVEGMRRVARCAAGVPSTERVNYRERRRYFSGWRLEREVYFGFLDHYTGILGRRPPVSRDRLHEALSAVIWSRLTGSEFPLAPCFHPPFSEARRRVDAGSPENRLAHAVARASGRSPYAVLLPLLERYEQELLTGFQNTAGSTDLAN
ncbi:TniQ family protein [Kitasatospora sp. NPDC005856]|uniref:TniQ family protein n=1 Tax=Kitasatospora sp. NPDC005856 TaxID=3154566 RepID=UPI0033E02C27